MKRLLCSGSMLLLACAVPAHAQLYKWVGPDGKVTYSDTPPPSSSARVETRPAAGSGTPALTGLPYEVAEAARAHPVVLYSGKDCGPCDQGRNLLTQRGIPFSEKTVSTSEDAALLRQLGGDTQLPLLTVGRSRERGFEPGAWNSALSAAGYPETSKLPRSYRNPPAQSLAPSRPAPQAQNGQARTDEAPPATDVPPAVGNAPPGFRF